MAEVKELKVYTEEEVSKHNTAQDCWIIIGEVGERKVYDVTQYLDDHPGGPEIILDLAGQNANDEFEDIGHSNDARALMEKYVIGKLKEDEKVIKKKLVAKAEKAQQSTTLGAEKSSSAFSTLILLAPVVVGILALYLKSIRHD
jgi:cytochrome b involved in lipid metabolism